MESDIERVRHVLQKKCAGKYIVEVEKSLVPGSAKVTLNMVFPLGPPTSRDVESMEEDFRQNVEEIFRELEPQFRVTAVGPVECEKF